MSGLTIQEGQILTGSVFSGPMRVETARANSPASESLAAAREATTLDRVHAAMLLQGGGRTNAVSAVYPKGSEEKQLIDAMLLAIPR